MGRSSEILRDEIKFSKFVGRMRKRVSEVFNDTIEDSVGTSEETSSLPEDWVSRQIMFKMISSMIMLGTTLSKTGFNRLASPRRLKSYDNPAEPYVGKDYSQDYIRRKVLRQTDQEILDQDTLIGKEITDGVIPDPKSLVRSDNGLGPPRGAPRSWC